MATDLIFLVAGASLLLGTVLPSALNRFAVSAPMVLVAVGMAIGLLPMPTWLDLDPVASRTAIEHVTELTVLIALMGVGLALDRPLRLKDRKSWRTWSATWRLLLVAMPLCIGAVWLLGWVALGVAAPAALLLGAALAPTDPVLASDVQVQGPDVDSPLEDIDEEDEVRFALTSEAGLNDGLAFPFVYAAILLASAGPVSGWLGRWLAWELVGKVAIGVLVGVACGWLLARIAFRAPAKSLRLAETGEPLLALAAVLLAYGLSELAGGYGFLAVFACAMAMRSFERDHEYHAHMHEVIERLERLLTLFVLLMLGMAMTNGLLSNLDWRGVVVAVSLVFVIRPLSGLLALGVGRLGRSGEVVGLQPRERWVAAAFGVRGVGSIYYLAYAGGHAAFPEERWLWSTVAFTIVLSVFVHGVAATPVMARLDRERKVA